MESKSIEDLCNQIMFLVKKNSRIPLNKKAKFRSHAKAVINGRFDAINEMIGLWDSLPPIIKGQLEPVIVKLDAIVKDLINAPSNGVDVVILTALEKPELKALHDVTKGLGVDWKRFHLLDEFQYWHVSDWSCYDGSLLTVVSATPNFAGMPAISVLTSQAIMKWKPKLVILIGITAGTEQNSNMGDILIPERIFTHDSGKVTPETKARYHITPDKWTTYGSASALGYIKNNYEAALKNTLAAVSNHNVGPIEVRFGPLACGNAVIDDADYIDFLLSGDRKLTGIEMEGYAFLYACNKLNSGYSKGLMIKSVCDFGQNKNDDNQLISSRISSFFTYELITKSNLFDFL